MSDELKAAVERYRKNDYICWSSNMNLDARLADAELLADAYLAERDETPIDEAFLRKCGFKFTNGEWWHRNVVGYLLKDGDTWEWYVCGIFACRIATRGQLVRLLSVLEGK